MINVYIDSNAWNWLSNHHIDLHEHLPRGEFSVFITREVEIEIQVIPNIGKDGVSKKILKEYIAKTVRSRDVETTSNFGFAVEGVPNHLQPYGGFDQGSFQSPADQTFYKLHEKLHIGKSIRPETMMCKNQADMSVAVRAFDSIVLTADKKKGPIMKAYEAGGMVLFLETSFSNEQKLSDAIHNRWPQLFPAQSAST